MIRAVFKCHPKVREVRLFGSRASGTHTSRSDLDLALFGEVTPLETQGIASELDELPLPYKYDLLAFEALADGPLREHILRVGILVFPGLGEEFRGGSGNSSVEEIEATYAELCAGHLETWSTLRNVAIAELRAIVTMGLLEANGSYMELARRFHVGKQDYKRFMDLLRRRQCVIDPAPFRRAILAGEEGRGN